MKLVFNELSYSFPQESIYEGQRVFERFLRTYLAGTRLGVKETIIIERNFDGALLAPNYPIEKWRNDNEIDEELRRVYRRINDFAEFVDTDLYNKLRDREFRCEVGSGVGLMLASELGFLSISFLGDPYWDKSMIPGILSYFEESSGEIVESRVNIYHSSHEEHLKDSESWIKKRIDEEKYDITSGQDLWNRREELFPHLLFFDSTRKQLYKYRKADADLKQIIRKILELEMYFSSWDGKSFDRKMINNADPESESTLTKYCDAHTFLSPEGVKVLFSWHIRFTGGNSEGRIFFDPDFNSKKCLIGHIGGKLPNVTFGDH